MRTLVFLAIRSLLRSKLSLLLLVAAVAGGVGFQVPNAANLDGYTQELLRQGVARSSGHVLVTPPPQELLGQVADKVRRLSALPFVEGVLPRLVHAGVLFRKEHRHPVRIVGIDPVAEEKANGFCSRIEAGRCLTPDDTRALVLGSQLADAVGGAADDRLKLVVPYDELGEVELSSRKYPVVGVVRGGGGFQEDKDLYVPAALLYGILDEADVASEILVFVSGDPQDQPALTRHAAAIREVLPDVQAQPWFAGSSLVANAIAGNRTIALISTAMVILAVMIPVFALLYVHVSSDRRSIAILGAIGFRRREIFFIYLLEAILVGVVGAAIGVGLGLGLCSWFDAHPIFANDGFVIRPDVSARAVLVPALILFGATVLAGLVPAVKAARGTPSEELREA